MYWIPASLFSMGQLALLRVEGVRSFFGIPQMIKHPPEPQEERKGGVMNYFKDSTFIVSIQFSVQCKDAYKSIMPLYNTLHGCVLLYVTETVSK